jgi:hypothetical protein
MTSFRRNLLLTGIAGLVLCGALALMAVWFVGASIVRPPFSHPVIALLLALILGLVSIAEIPMMVFTLRRLVAERKGNNRGAVAGLHLLYVSFASIYGAPVILLTGNLLWGLVLCGLGLVRLLAGLAFIRETTSE